MAMLWFNDTRMPLEAVGLDVDGVLRDTARRAYDTLCKMYAHFGGTKPEYAAYVSGYLGAKRLEFAAAHGIEHENEERLIEYYRANHVPDNETAPFPDVAPFCAHVRSRGLPLFIVSSCRADWVHEWFEQHGLHVHFAHIESAARHKHQHLRNVCERLKVKPWLSCYVGDMCADMGQAVQAALVPVGITRGYDTEKLLRRSGATVVVESLAELGTRIA